MSMTQEEKFAKQLIMTLLSEQGYPTYAKIFNEFEFNLTTNPDVIAYLDPREGRIVVNRGLEEGQVSVVLRHEILHHYLKHEKRLLSKLAKDSNLDYDELINTEMNDVIEDLRHKLYGTKDFNIAADYEISNLAYTDVDKDLVRKINLNGRILPCLVTEDDHPDWVDDSVEEMYQKLLDIRKNDKNKIDDSVHLGQLKNRTTFVDLNGVVYGI